MKIRSSFVANSSSASFSIPLEKLTGLQVSQIINHPSVGEELGMEWTEYEWDISLEGTFICGFTDMDNFDMATLLEKIGVDPQVVTWSE